MSELDFWHDWAIDLDDAAFANAWAGQDGIVGNLWETNR